MTIETDDPLRESEIAREISERYAIVHRELWIQVQANSFPSGTYTTSVRVRDVRLITPGRARNLTGEIKRKNIGPVVRPGKGGRGLLLITPSALEQLLT